MTVQFTNCKSYLLYVVCRDGESESMQEADESQVQTRIRYLLKVGSLGEELSSNASDA